MFSPYHAAQLYANDAAYLSQTVTLDPKPEDHVLAYTAASLHATLQAGVQTPEEAAQMTELLKTPAWHNPTAEELAQMQVTNCHLTVGPGDHVIRTVTLTGLLPTESNNSMTITNSIASRGPSHTFTGPLASAHAVEPGHDCPTPTMQLQLDVQRLTIRAQKAEHKLEALTSEFGQYQTWVRQTMRTQGKILEELEQRMRETQAELETLRPKTLELHSSGDSTTGRSPRRRKIQKP